MVLKDDWLIVSPSMAANNHGNWHRHDQHHSIDTNGPSNMTDLEYSNDNTKSHFPIHPNSKLCTDDLDAEERHFELMIKALLSYETNTLTILQKYQKDFEELPTRQKALLSNYPTKIQEAAKLVHENQGFFNTVVAPHLEMMAMNEPKVEPLETSKAQDTIEAAISHPLSADNTQSVGMADRLRTIILNQTEADNLKSTLRQLVREWASKGASEREHWKSLFFDPLLESFPDKRNQKKVLVPGAGLGRLAYEISQLGFQCQGNEWSLFMLLSSEMLLNRQLVPNSIKVYPYVLPFSNIYSSADQFQAITIPDIQVKHAPAEFSMTAGDFLEVYGEQVEEWDAIVTNFFIDTAKNIVNYLEIIYKTLVPGGVWINFGPLLYHFEGHAKEPSIELSAEELSSIIRSMGFIMELEKVNIDSSYAQNVHSMHQTIYKCWYFVARKPL